MRAIISRKIMRSRDAQCNTGEWPQGIVHIYTRPFIILKLQNSNVSFTKLTVDFPAFATVKFRKIWQTSGKCLV